jgi:hypothetical protein
MDAAVSQFLTKGTALIAIVVVIVNFFVKRIVEMTWPKLRPTAGELDHKPMYSGKAGMWWNEVGLYALPVFIGCTFGRFVNEPFMFGDIATLKGRVFYAGVVGWFADFLYTVVQKALYKSTGVELPSPGQIVAVQQTTTTVVASGSDAATNAENAQQAIQDISKTS